MKKLLFLAAIITLAACSKESDVIPQPVIMSSYKSANLSILPNSGGNGASDWIVSAKDNVPDGWKINQYGRVKVDRDIRYEGYFVRVTSKSQFMFDSPAAIVNATWHVLSLKYRSNTEVRIAVKYSPTCTYCLAILPPSDKVQVFTVRFWSPEVRWLRFYNSPIKPGYIELDQVNLYDCN